MKDIGVEDDVAISKEDEIDGTGWEWMSGTAQPAHRLTALAYDVRLSRESEGSMFHLHGTSSRTMEEDREYGMVGDGPTAPGCCERNRRCQ